MARQVQVPQLDVGDWVVVHDCGANTMVCKDLPHADLCYIHTLTIQLQLFLRCLSCSHVQGMFSRHCSRPAPPVYGYTRSGEKSPEVVLLKEKETDTAVLTFWD